MKVSTAVLTGAGLVTGLAIRATMLKCIISNMDAFSVIWETCGAIGGWIGYNLVVNSWWIGLPFLFTYLYRKKKGIEDETSDE